MARVPLLLDLADRGVVCVGGGPVAARKVLPLAQEGARVAVVAPVVVAELAAAAAVIRRRRYVRGDLRASGPAGGPPTMLAVAATGLAEVDGAVAEEALAAGIWCLRTDGRGDVAVPSVLRREGLTVAVATGAPALTRRLRQHLDAVVEARWGEAASVLAALRADPDVRASLADLPAAERQRRWRAAVEAALTGGGPVAAAELRGILIAGS